MFESDPMLLIHPFSKHSCPDSQGLRGFDRMS